MKKYKHVYCTCCVHYMKVNGIHKLGNGYLAFNAICAHCYPYDAQDSRGNDLRINYKESLSGWFWLTKNNIKEYFKYKMWRK